jgi:hypothetical protein
VKFADADVSMGEPAVMTPSWKVSSLAIWGLLEPLGASRT